MIWLDILNQLIKKVFRLMFSMVGISNLKQWFVDVKMSGFIGGNIKQLFKSEESYNSFLKKFLG